MDCQDLCPGLGYELTAEVERTFERIRSFPEVWLSLSTRVRRCVVYRFSCGIVHRIRGINMQTVIPDMVIDENALQETFVCSSGPGGQNVNKVATAVQLRFDIQNSPSLPNLLRERLRSVAANRITAEGILVIDARRFRTQEQNRQDARGARSI